MKMLMAAWWLMAGTGCALAQLSVPGGGSYTLHPATTNTLGGVIPDGVTLSLDMSGHIAVQSPGQTKWIEWFETGGTFAVNTHNWVLPNANQSFNLPPSPADGDYVVVGDYWGNATTTLRGFNPGPSLPKIVTVSGNGANIFIQNGSNTALSSITMAHTGQVATFVYSASGLLPFPATGWIETDYIPVIQYPAKLSGGTCTVSSPGIFTNSVLVPVHMGTSTANAGPLIMAGVSFSAGPVGTATIKSFNTNDDDNIMVLSQ